MKRNQIAAQLYTIRDHLKEPKQIADSLKRVRAIGYEAVQVSGMGEIADAELVRILDGEGLTCCATHEPSQQILDDPDGVVEHLGNIKCTMTAYPYPAGIDMNSESAVRDLAQKLDKAGAVLAEAGMVLGYHNHNIEFVRFDGKNALEIIYEETSPAHLVGEIDTYWVQAGGGSVESWCRKLYGRLPFIHLKDFGIDADRSPVFKEIGYGNLDWSSIIAEAERSGSNWFIVEQDRNWADDDPFKSLEMSYRFLVENICAD